MKQTQMEIKGPLQIIGLEVENYKRIKAVRLNPKGSVVELTGKNRQGKTSLLDAIWSALKSAAVANDNPIHDGATKATIRLNLGEIVVKKVFTEKTATLVVESADGRSFGTPQRLLDELIGELSFDPLAFSRMDQRKQYEQLRRVVKLDIDVDKLEGLNATDYVLRTEINRDAKAKRAQAEAVIVPPGTLAETIDETEFLDQIENAAKHNADIERRKARRAGVASKVQQLLESARGHHERAEQLRQDAATLDANAIKWEAEAKEEQQRLDSAIALPEPIDVSAARVALDKARAANVASAKGAQRKQLDAEAAALEKQSTELSSTMEARIETIRSAIAKANLPINGLAFGNGQITYNGQPFSQASGAETLMVSMAIGMAANPRVRVILIRDASLLDEQSRAIVCEMAEKYGYQVWLERVSSDKSIGVHIEDGEVVSVDGKAA